MTSADQFQRNLKGALACIRQDRVPIIVVTVVLVVLGAAIGKLTTSTSSTALLAMTPLPFRASFTNTATDDGLARMIPPTIDITTASLLCMSDDVLQKTMDSANASGKLSAPIKTIKNMKSMLKFEMNVAKETPYELIYSPLLMLTANATQAADAKLIADAWALNCKEAATALQDAIQGPPGKAFDTQKVNARVDLAKAEEELRLFSSENNVPFMIARMDDLIRTVNQLDRDEIDLRQEISRETALAAAYGGLDAEEPPKLDLAWKPSDRLVALVLGKQSANVKPDVASEGTNLLTVEHINETYTKVHTEMEMAQAALAGSQERLKELQTLRKQSFADMTQLRKDLASLRVEEDRLNREKGTLETAFKDAALKREYAEMAGSLKYAQIQILSPGAEWPAPRFRWAIICGFAAGMFGCVFASCASCLTRMFLAPALKS